MFLTISLPLSLGFVVDILYKLLTNEPSSSAYSSPSVLGFLKGPVLPPGVRHYKPFQNCHVTTFVVVTSLRHNDDFKSRDNIEKDSSRSHLVVERGSFNCFSPRG